MRKLPVKPSNLDRISFCWYLFGDSVVDCIVAEIPRPIVVNYEVILALAVVCFRPKVSFPKVLVGVQVVRQWSN